jgi:hypothetical protein
MAEEKRMVAAHLAAAIIGRTLASGDAVKDAVKTYYDVLVALEEEENRRISEDMEANRRAGSDDRTEPKTYPDS